MMTALVITFLALLSTEAVGTAVFLAVYMRSDWRSTEVGRHLAFYSAALFLLLLLSLVSFVVHSLWLAWPILAGHVAFDLLIWQRVYLVVKAQREG